MKYKIGDRLKYESKSGWMVWEVVEIIPDNSLYFSVCLEINSIITWKVGDARRWGFHHPYWGYIGNYAKVNNFNALYNLLNS